MIKGSNDWYSDRWREVERTRTEVEEEVMRKSGGSDFC
jgi:hypothetical protein